jgi:hypothetical protein
MVEFPTLAFPTLAGPANSSTKDLSVAVKFSTISGTSRTRTLIVRQPNQ